MHWAREDDDSQACVRYHGVRLYANSYLTDSLDYMYTLITTRRPTLQLTLRVGNACFAEFDLVLKHHFIFITITFFEEVMSKLRPHKPAPPIKRL